MLLIRPDFSEEVCARVTLVKIPDLGAHGEELDDDIADIMFDADLLIGISRFSLAHTRARKQATDNKARYLSLADYSFDLLEDPAILTDYKQQAMLAKTLADVFTDEEHVSIQTAKGTDVSLDITGRVGNPCPGIVKKPGDLGSPPDIEANVAPLESYSEGVVKIDGSIPFPGLA